ncbi:MAG: HAD family hydrolase [Sandaracinaceae bacterium]|nr:HAD family hydrolase [Sandaracinaceae bacterium]
MRYPDLIFDLDDTLIDSFAPYVAAHQRVAEELRMRVPSRDELVVYLDTWERTLERMWPDTDLDPFMTRYAELTHEYEYPPIAGCWIRSGSCASADTACGSSPSAHAGCSRCACSRRGSAEHFHGIFAFEDQPVTKPDPRCFEPVWQAGARPEQSLYVGDRVDDQLAASSAGVVFVAVATGPEGAVAWERIVPASHRLESAAELPAWLAEHG